MDVEMLRASDYILASQQSQEQELAVNVIQELKAQLYTHLATLITKMAATVSVMSMFKGSWYFLYIKFFCHDMNPHPLWIKMDNMI